MKRTIVLILVALCYSITFAQGNYKIDNTLQSKTEFQQNEGMFHVIVMMTEKYNDVQLAQKTALMTKEQRRQFLIADRKAFCQNSQLQVIDFLDSYRSQDLVNHIKSFWSFNGFACQASAQVIKQLAERKDVGMIYFDPKRNMLPLNEKPKPASAKSTAWHVDKVNAPAVWSYDGATGYTGEGVIVAVIDSGVDYNHIDIANSMWDGGTEFPHHGYDVFNHDNDPMDDHCHGTHVAGIIAGQGTAGTQTGVAPDSKIMAVKVISAAGEGSDEQVMEGIEFALEHGTDIINISAGASGAGACSFYRDIFTTSLNAGVVAAIAAGNDGTTQYTYPVPFNVNAPGNCPPPWLHPDQESLIAGGLSAVISIGATDSNDAHCDFSSVGPVTWAYGEHVGNYNDYPYQNGDASQPGLIRPDISAPGSNITSLNFLTTNGYIEYDGTSMATPCVAGVLALLLDANPDLTPAELDSIIELTSVGIGNIKKNNRVGAGRIDALAAVNALFHHGPTQLTAELDGDLVFLQWEAAEEALSYNVYRDGIRIANNLNATDYTDHLNYGGPYTYYITAQFDGDMTSLPSNYVTVTKEVEVEAEVINNTKVSLSWNLPTGIIDGFESGDFYQNMWINDATSPWEITTNNPYEGTYCAKSTNTGMFTTSKISLGVNVPTSCVVSYYARISCFPLNGGGFFIDNVQQGETLKDEVPWTCYSVPLSAGNHLLEWKYANQLAEGEYENAFYIDQITVGNAFNIYRAHCDESDTLLIASGVAEAYYVDNGWDDLPIGQYKYGISNDDGYSIAWSECLDKDVMVVDENNAMEIKVYPNPSNNVLFVETRLIASLPAKTKYIITNLSGQTLVSGHITNPTQQIDVSGLADGMYFVRIQGYENIVAKKFTIAR